MRHEIEESIGVDKDDFFKDDVLNDYVTNKDSDVSSEPSDDADSDSDLEERRRFKHEMKWETTFMGMHRQEFGKNFYFTKTQCNQINQHINCHLSNTYSFGKLAYDYYGNG